MSAVTDSGFVCVCGWQIRPRPEAHHASCKGCDRDYQWRAERWWLVTLAAAPQPSLGEGE